MNEPMTEAGKRLLDDPDAEIDYMGSKDTVRAYILAIEAEAARTANEEWDNALALLGRAQMDLAVANEKAEGLDVDRLAKVLHEWSEDEECGDWAYCPERPGWLKQAKRIARAYADAGRPW